MSALYAESSAVLRWLLSQAEAAAARRTLAEATTVVTSSLTTVEVARTLARLTATGQLRVAQRHAAWNAYLEAMRHWKIMSCSEEIQARARASFPAEPLRTMDALHLATALSHAEEVEPLDVLSFDDGIRRNAMALGLRAVP